MSRLCSLEITLEEYRQKEIGLRLALYRSSLNLYEVCFSVKNSQQYPSVCHMKDLDVVLKNYIKKQLFGFIVLDVDMTMS